MELDGRPQTYRPPRWGRGTPYATHTLPLVHPYYEEGSSHSTSSDCPSEYQTRRSSYHPTQVSAPEGSLQKGETATGRPYSRAEDT